jgi:restriction endonuclease Mrr
MKITKEELRGIIRQELSEGKDLKVGDEVLFNGKYKGLVKQIHTRGKLKGMIDVIKKGRSSVTTVDASSVKKVNESVTEAKKADLSKFTTKTLRDLYAVLDGKASTPKEKASVEQLRAELVKRKVIKKEDTVKITKERLKEIVREELVEVKLADSLSSKDILAKMKKDAKFKWQQYIGTKGMEAISKKKTWSYKELDNLLPDYVPGNEIGGLFKGE